MFHADNVLRRPNANLRRRKRHRSGPEHLNGRREASIVKAVGDARGIATRTLRAMFWAYGSFLGARFLSFTATAILARLIIPEDFGLVALALIAMAFIDIFSGLGVGEALIIVNEDEAEEKAETAFAVTVLVGFVSGAALAIFGPVAAAFFDQSELVEMMPVLGVTFVLRGLGGTHAALAQKRLDFRSRSAAELADAGMRGAVSVVLALTGAGVWSLVIGYVVGSAAWSITLWLLVSWRPRFRPRRAHLRSLLSFGGPLTGVNVMGAFLSQFDYVVIGRVLGTAQLGFYSIANRIPELFIGSLGAVGGRVLFPAFASLRSDDVPRAFLTSLRYTALLVLPLTLYFVIFAEPLTIALLGQQWRPSIEAMQVLCLWVGVGTLGQVCGDAFKGRGRVDLIVILAVPQAVVLVIGSLALVERGIIAVAWVRVGVVMCAVPIAILIAQRLFRLRFRAVVEALRPALVGGTGLALVLLVIERAISRPWPAVLAGACAGAVVYLGLILLLAPDTLKMLKATAFPRTPADEPENTLLRKPTDVIDERHTF